MSPLPDKKTSVTRLRIGVIFFVVWWLPVYLIAPALDTLFGETSNPDARHKITVTIIIIQTIIGITGALLIGKTTMSLRKVKYKRLPSVVWGMFWRGDLEINPENYKKKN